MTEANKSHPDEVQCHVAKDGGAMVHARIGYATVFAKAFSNEQEARDCAAELFLKEFDTPERDVDGPDF